MDGTETEGSAPPQTFDQWFERVQKCYQMHGLKIPDKPTKLDRQAFASSMTAFDHFQATKPN